MHLCMLGRRGSFAKFITESMVPFIFTEITSIRPQLSMMPGGGDNSRQPRLAAAMAGGGNSQRPATMAMAVAFVKIRS